jgi:hypothetical protein
MMIQTTSLSVVEQHKNYLKKSDILIVNLVMLLK